jgi:hypothetical protein
MKPENEVIDKSDWRIASNDFDTTYLEVITKNRKRLDSYKKFIFEQYNKTKEMALFLDNLRTLAKAEKIMAQKSSKKRLIKSSIA